VQRFEVAGEVFVVVGDRDWGRTENGERGPEERFSDDPR